MGDLYQVKVVEHGSGIEECIGKPVSARKAERISDGIETNLNHAEFYVISVKELEKEIDNH